MHSPVEQELAIEAQAPRGRVGPPDEAAIGRLGQHVLRSDRSCARRRAEACEGCESGSQTRGGERSTDLDRIVSQLMETLLTVP